jgi:ubiquinone/menaquinone biosynthesis C-methylase UbiE
MKTRPRLFAATFGLVVLFGFGLSYASAQLDQLPAKEYVDRMGSDKRLPTLKVDEVIAKLGLKPGDIVADVGSGSGAYSIPFAKAVAPNGIVYAVDIDQEMLNYVADQAKKAGVTNLRTVLGEYNDPKLPVHDVDVAFFQQVLHMIINRQTYLDTVVNYLKPDGRVVVIDKNPEQSPNSWMWLKQSDVDTWMAAISFYPAQQINLFTDRYFAVYRRPEGKSVPLLNKHTPSGAPVDSGNN